MLRRQDSDVDAQQSDIDEEELLFQNASPTNVPYENFNVAVRIRPPLPRERQGPSPFMNVTRVTPDGKALTLVEHLDIEDGRTTVFSSQTFTFDVVYQEHDRQKEVYERSAKAPVLSILQGYNATLIAYGQTGTGKTYTMEGFTNDENRGIIPRATEEIFSYIRNCRNRGLKFLVRASYLEIYNEIISDLLRPQDERPGKLKISMDKQRGVYVKGLSEWIVRSPNEIYGLMEKGLRERATGSNRMNEHSSRSHAIFVVIVEVMDESEEGEKSLKIGKLNIVDLAGSEKVKQTQVTGQQFEEAKNINLSLLQLGNVIKGLTSETASSHGHIPYRNSKLTHLLMDSLGGNCRTTLIACITPAGECYQESRSTLTFANRAKNIKNKPMVNEDVDQRAQISRLERELKVLRRKLEDQSNPDARFINELQARHRQAEDEKVAALEALQERDRLYSAEQRSKTQLEDRIGELEAQLMTGGYSGSDPTQNEYKARLDELDRERQVIDEDKAQVDRYKQLLLKQRDIMLALTTRLNERDETILKLQEEIDAYDVYVQQLEEERGVSSPVVHSPTSMPKNTKAAMSAVAACRVTSPTGAVSYKSVVDSSTLLSAEEKMAELMCTVPSDVTSAVMERVEAVARQQSTDFIGVLTKEVDMWKSKCTQAEERRRSAEYTLELTRVSGDNAEFQDKVKRYIAQETDVLKMDLVQQLDETKRRLEEEESLRRRALNDLERLQIEAGKLRSHVDPSKVDEVDRVVAQAMHVTTTVHKELLKRVGGMANDTATGGSSAADDRTHGKQLEERLAALQRQHEQVQNELRERVEERNNAVRALKEERSRSHVDPNALTSKDAELQAAKKKLATQIKDRKALKTILESRIKVKVQNIAKLQQDLFTAGHNMYDQEAQRKVGGETESLLSLVLASIDAMQADA